MAATCVRASAWRSGGSRSTNCGFRHFLNTESALKLKQSKIKHTDIFCIIFLKRFPVQFDTAVGPLTAPHNLFSHQRAHDGRHRHNIVFISRKVLQLDDCKTRMSKSGSLRGALGGLYAHNAAESKKAREETRVSKMIRESDRQFHLQVRTTSHLCAPFHSNLD